MDGVDADYAKFPAAVLAGASMKKKGNKKADLVSARGCAL